MTKKEAQQKYKADHWFMVRELLRRRVDIISQLAPEPDYSEELKAIDNLLSCYMSELFGRPVEYAGPGCMADTKKFCRFFKGYNLV